MRLMTDHGVDYHGLFRLLGQLPGAERTPPNYPQPIPVTTGDFIGYQEDDPNMVIAVILRPKANTGEAAGTSEGKILLPGGIFEVGKHDTTWGIGVSELAEETGLVPDLSLALHFLHSTRSTVDQRSWCGLKTTHCNNFIVAAPVSGEVRIQDTAEVAKHRWVDVRTVTPEQTSRGHYQYFAAWREFLEHDMDPSILPILLSDRNPDFLRSHPQWKGKR